MRLRVGDHEVEGSAAEVAELLRLLSTANGRTEAQGTQAKMRPVDSGPDGASPFVSEAVAIDVVTRRPLAEAQKTLLQRLDVAGEAWTTAPELQEALGLSTREFAGLLGAFGRRLTHTPGTGSRSFFDQYWDHDHGYNLYRLPPSVRSALRKAKVV